eukprot:CAMPEP_0170169350 /NCGR_PEP_ID=MMETSP0040_2-20121228/2261_1 /TAXON_ID=641309 /ORGANISM="Lotharella oceanica, Strain CCMP622" /LENGTH=185 /DNA_ID=CAMNT_0010408031 /DNA_START=205 /DNA_END=759 /DNA_ORIENTATION=+
MKRTGEVLTEEMRLDIVNRAEAVDRRIVEMKHVQKELEILANRIGLLDQRPLDHEYVSIDCRGQSVTTSFETWKKSQLIEIAIMAARKTGEVPFLDKDPAVVRKIVEYLKTGDAAILQESNGEVPKWMRTHYLNYFGLSLPKPTNSDRKLTEVTVKAPFKDNRTLYEGRITGGTVAILYDDGDVW